MACEHTWNGKEVTGHEMSPSCDPVKVPTCEKCGLSKVMHDFLRDEFVQSENAQLRAALLDIANMDTRRSNATVRRMAARAWAALSPERAKP